MYKLRQRHRRYACLAKQMKFIRSSRMIRVLTCLGMMSALLLTFTVSTDFVLNGYQRVYALSDPRVELRLNEFPHQPGQSGLPERNR